MPAYMNINQEAGEEIPVQENPIESQQPVRGNELMNEVVVGQQGSFVRQQGEEPADEYGDRLERQVNDQRQQFIQDLTGVRVPPRQDFPDPSNPNVPYVNPLVEEYNPVNVPNESQGMSLGQGLAIAGAGVAGISALSALAARRKRSR